MSSSCFVQHCHCQQDSAASHGAPKSRVPRSKRLSAETQSSPASQPPQLSRINPKLPNLDPVGAEAKLTQGTSRAPPCFGISPPSQRDSGCLLPGDRPDPLWLRGCGRQGRHGQGHPRCRERGTATAKVHRAVKLYQCTNVSPCPPQVSQCQRLWDSQGRGVQAQCSGWPQASSISARKPRKSPHWPLSFFDG